jgi:hypothetical protein
MKGLSMNGVSYGMNRRDLDRVFKDLGGEIIYLRRTGELQYRHVALRGEPCPRANARRKDASRKQVRYVLRVIEATMRRTAANDDRF